MTASLQRQLRALASSLPLALRTGDRYDKEGVQYAGLLSEDSEQAATVVSERRRPTSLAITVLRSILSIMQLLALALVPSFIQNLFHTSREPRKIHPTSFLDGVRGVASFIVAYAHLIPAYEQWLVPSFGMNYDDEAGSSILQLPFLRVLMAGRPMVHIFMIISGYVLSIKSVQYMRRGEFDKMYDTLVSMIFRRGIRLFLPSIAGMVLMEISASMGWQKWQSEPTLWGKLQTIYTNAGHLFYSCWQWDHENSEELLQLWTIPVEFACSMLLFLVLMGVSKLRTWIRFAIVAGLAVHSSASMHWGPFEFMVGLMLAEIEEILGERRRQRTSSGGQPVLPTDNPHTVAGSLRGHFRSGTVLWVTLLLTGLFLAGYPIRDAEKTFGIAFFTRLTPQIYYDKGAPLPSFFWFSIAAVLIIASLFRLPSLQMIFTTPVAQYLGDISYGVYIVHYATVLTLTSPIQKKAHDLAGGTDTQLKRLVVVLLELIMLMTVVVWQADVFWRFIDRPSVHIARRIETLCRRPER